jgi:RND family efflux transporter MFP subunit
MKRFLKFGIPVLLILAGVIYFNRQLTLTVLVEPAETGTAVNAVTGTVEVLAYIDIHVKAENRGRIAENVVEAGQVVEAGEVIAVQEAEDLDLRIEQVRIRLDAANARNELESTHRIDLETLEDEREGTSLAVELKQAPVSQLERVERELRKKRILLELEQIQERETLRLLENQLAQLTLQKGQMTTEAPFGGTIAAINAFKGDLISGGQNLVRLVSHGRYLLMELTEEDYFGVADGQPVTLRLASYPDRTFEGTVTRLEDVANASNKTRNVIVEVEAPDSVLVPGLTGEGYLVKEERAGAVLVPRRALIGNLVYVVVDGKVEVRRVRAGFRGLNQAEILEGVEAGELVVLEDQNLLRPGDRVDIEQAGTR